MTVISTATARETGRATYVPFGLGKLRVTELTDSEVFALDARIVTGTIKECLVYPEPEGVFTPEFLERAQFNSLDELVDSWQQPENSIWLRAALTDLLFKTSFIEGYRFHFRPDWVLGNGAVSVVVGDPTGMAHAREVGLIPKP